MMNVDYQIVSTEHFDSYIEDINARLKKDAPEWHITMQAAPTKAGANHTVYYHLARKDFSKGLDATWEIPLNEWIFGYQEQTSDGTIVSHLLTLHPLEYRGSDDK